MKAHARTTVAVLCCSSAMIVCACEDSSARQREAVQTQIRDAGYRLQQAVARAGGSSDPGTAQTFTTIASDLGRMDGGEPGQQGARAIIAAAAWREAATIHLAAASNIETELAKQRSVVHHRLDGALRLRDAAAALETVNARSQREQLRVEIEAARHQATALRTAIDELDGPITALTQQNATDANQIETLRLEVGKLLRRAQELGYYEGLETYRQAVQTRRNADRIEYEVSQREIELDYELTPELVYADMQAQHLESMTEALEAASQQLEAFVVAATGEINATRKQVADMTALLSTSVKDLDETVHGMLQTTYAEAQSALEKAAGQAQNALRHLKGEDVQSARLVAVQVQETIGRLHWSKARGLLDHKMLLERVNQSGLVAGGAFNAPLAATASQYDESIEQARTAYASSQDLAGQITSRGQAAQIDALTRSIGQAIMALGGVPTGSSAPSYPDAAPVSSEPAASAPASGDLHFATAQALVDWLATLPLSGQSMRAQLGVLHASTPQGQRVLRMQTQMAESFAAIDEAMRAQFGQGLFDAMGPMAASMMPDYSQARLTEQTDDRAVMVVTAMGMQDRTVLRNINGSWKMDLDELDPTKAAQLGMAEQMANALARSTPDLVNRIRSGAFRSQQEAMMAFNQAMTGGMGGGAGMPGGRK